MRIKIFDYVIATSFHKTPMLSTTGFTNETKDRRFILFADYDSVNLDVVERDAAFVQANYDTGTMLIVSSSKDYNYSEDGKPYGNYHLIGLTKIEFPAMLEILDHLRCDFHFKRGWRYQYRSWVLRLHKKLDRNNNAIKDKPVLIDILPADTKRIYSKAHIIFLEKYFGKSFGISIRKCDNSKHIEIINYITR
jgi:hypothetical protein